MKRATIALRSLLARIAGGIGAEGAFLILATITGAIGASYIGPAGPWIVVAAVSLLVSIALALPRDAA